MMRDRMVVMGRMGRIVWIIRINRIIRIIWIIRINRIIWIIWIISKLCW